MLNKNLTAFVLLMMLKISCSKEDDPSIIDHQPSDNQETAVVTVDANELQGTIMRIEQANGHSTTSPLPGENAKEWLQGLNHTVLRTWIQLRYVYNNGNVNYNYKYNGSNVPLEISLAYYSQVADSLLIALSGYTGTSSWTMPARGADYQKFVKETVIYYKQKFPKIKYIQVGNEPGYRGETVAEYYPIYQDYYRGINDANAALGLTGKDRILISNGAFTSTKSFNGVMDYTKQFLNTYAADTDPEKKLDFFSINTYTEQENPKLFETAKEKINNAMQAEGLPEVPVFVTEYGLIGGGFIPSVWDQSDIMTAWPAAQLAKAYYLYQGGIDKVFNWSIHHGSILHKSELGDLNNAYANPYGNALVLWKKLSSRGTRIKAVSTELTPTGLGINAIASMGNEKGIAVLVWNYNWTNNTGSQKFEVEIKNIPQSEFADKLNTKVYIVDSKNNNYYTNRNQAALNTSINLGYDYASSIKVPLTLEKNAVALILITP